MIVLPEKPVPKTNDSDQQFEKLLNSVFQMLSAQQKVSRTDPSISKLDRKAH
jgi:hypothetical protein